MSSNGSEKKADPNLSVELDLHLQDTVRGGGEGREGEKRTLERRREELLVRMREKVELLREDGLEVEEEMRKVREAGERLVGRVEEQGNLADGEKVRVHLQEVERLTSLLEVLGGRLGRTERQLQRAEEGEQRVRQFPLPSLVLWEYCVDFMSQ